MYLWTGILNDDIKDFILAFRIEILCNWISNTLSFNMSTEQEGNNGFKSILLTRMFFNSQTLKSFFFSFLSRAWKKKREALFESLITFEKW